MTLISTRPVAVQLYVAFGVLHDSVLVWTDTPQRLPATPPFVVVFVPCGTGVSSLTQCWMWVTGRKGQLWKYSLPAVGRAQPQGSSRRLGNPRVSGVVKLSLLLLFTPHPSTIGYPMVPTESRPFNRRNI